MWSRSSGLIFGGKAVKESHTSLISAPPISSARRSDDTEVDCSDIASVDPTDARLRNAQAVELEPVTDPETFALHEWHDSHMEPLRNSSVFLAIFQGSRSRSTHV